MADESDKSASAQIWKSEGMKYCVASVAAGFAIGVAGLIYSRLGGLVGAFCFSFGLYYVVLKELKLYTGRIGYLSETFWRFVVMLALNFVGAALAGALASASYPTDKIVEITTNNLQLSDLNVLGRAFLCGMMMYFAVDGWKKTKNPFSVCLGVFIFVACGFEHCVADMFYFSVSGVLATAAAWKFIALAVLGNTIGAVFLRKISLS